MNLPNLLGLSLATDASLFEHLSERGGGKRGCIKHVEPIITDDDENADVNCAVDGYIMFKGIDGAAPPQDYSGKFVDMTVDGSPVRMIPLLKRTQAAAVRKLEFERRHADWIRNTFPIVCDRGAGLSPVTWEGYGEELAKLTEWYFLDEEQKRGHLFLQLFDTTRHKIRHKMPIGGAFSGRYLYIALVCASGGRGYGKVLMKYAEEACRVLGCEGIALASLSNSAGFYYSLGFRFNSKWDGAPIDVTAWTTVELRDDGTTKVVLNDHLDVDPFGAGQSGGNSSIKREREDDATERERSRLRSLFDETIERARSLYSKLAALSFM